MAISDKDGILSIVDEDSDSAYFVMGNDGNYNMTLDCPTGGPVHLSLDAQIALMGFLNRSVHKHIGTPEKMLVRDIATLAARYPSYEDFREHALGNAEAARFRNSPEDGSLLSRMIDAIKNPDTDDSGFIVTKLRELLAEPDTANAKTEPDTTKEKQPMFRNFYKCYRCKHEWEDVYSAQPDDDCPECGARHVSPHKSEDV